MRWLLRRFRYVRELEERIVRHERLERRRQMTLGRPFAVGSPEDVRRWVDVCLAQRMPAGIAWDVTVCELSPGVVGIQVDTERKARS
jgi:hypothetical protein